MRKAGIVVSAIVALGCGHRTDASSSTDSGAALRRTALEMVVRAQAKLPAVPPPPSAAYCPQSATNAHFPGCEANNSDHVKLLVETQRHLDEVQSAFFAECRTRRDKLARMITTQPKAPELLVQFVAGEIAGGGGRDRVTSDLGGMPYLRGRFQESLMKALADALDDQVTQSEKATMEHIDTVRDDDLKYLDGAADAGRVGKLIDMSLFYVGKQSSHDDE